MPSEHKINDHEAQQFCEIIELFQKTKNDQCISLLINAVSTETGLGMYEDIRFALQFQNHEMVIPALADGLKSTDPGRASRCCWWAIDIEAWELKKQIEPLLFSQNEDVKESA